ncbi:MAG: hypothetical protein FH756_02860 [Firmicutes bacterium]|nr:hypothetical protein [Bacillota bacterium]
MLMKEWEIKKILTELPEEALDALKELSTVQRKGKKVRGFEPAKGFEGKVANLPRRATPGSGGYDIWPLEEITLQPGERYSFHTGIKAYMPKNEVLLVNIRSSYGIKHDIELCNEQGWIDSDYYSNVDNDGLIIVKVKNTGNKPFTFQKKEPFAQGMFVTYHVTDDDCPLLAARNGGLGHSFKNLKT